MRFAAPIIALFLFLQSCDNPESYSHDLIITNASVLNTITGKVETNRTIVIDSGFISEVTDQTIELTADTIIDAKNKLVVPGFIDAVGHLDDIFGDRPDTLKSTVQECVTKFTYTYLPYGVTTVRNSGDGTGYYAIADFLFQNRNPAVPDFYFSGGSLAGWYEGTPYINHLLVADSTEAEYWVNSLYNTGSVKSVKLYCNGAMNYSIFNAALRKAIANEMIVTSQVQNEITIDSALALGLRNFEHASTLCYQDNLFDFKSDPAFNDTLEKYWADEERGSRIYTFLEAANFSGANNPEIISTIKSMSANHASMTTSLHFFAQWLGKTWYCSSPKASRFDCSYFSNVQKRRCINGYSILSGYVKMMYDEGVILAMGTDHRDGGKAVLSEILLLNELGIPMENCLQIATINTARTIGMEQIYGSIDKGKRANVIIFDQSPITNPKNILEKKTVIKDGQVFSDSQGTH